MELDPQTEAGRINDVFAATLGAAITRQIYTQCSDHEIVYGMLHAITSMGNDDNWNKFLREALDEVILTQSGEL